MTITSCRNSCWSTSTQDKLWDVSTWLCEPGIPAYPKLSAQTSRPHRLALSLLPQHQ
ncbi:rCG59471 [Rattus norvegicus]|uniref:RCG59471 n=1 Tax=Rattus norvegicus TaxID=10116 RepID=A6HQT4_RAT|nr:rCG59471 [Rattus norvegicus]